MADWEWICFQNRVSLTERMVELGGRCAAMLEELVSHPVKPTVARRIETVFLSKGLQGTTAIEGNTLTLDQVRDIVEEKAKAYPPSRRHLQQEILNVLEAYQFIGETARSSPDALLGSDTIREAHRVITKGLDQVEAIPGRFRTGKVVVGSVYVPPPADRVADLVARLRPWLGTERFATSPLLNGTIKAIVAHVYVAWIHPFDDGNGRTSRAIEYGLLQAAGIPRIGAVLLANHYNLTREVYVRELRRTSQEHRGDLTAFVEYALQGLRDSLGEALEAVREHVFSTSWENYVFERFRTEYGAALSEARARARTLALWLSGQSEAQRREDIVQAPGVAMLYGRRTAKTLTRDLGLLRRLELIMEASGGRYAARKGVMNAFRIGDTGTHDGAPAAHPGSRDENQPRMGQEAPPNKRMHPTGAARP